MSTATFSSVCFDGGWMWKNDSKTSQVKKRHVKMLPIRGLIQSLQFSKKKVQDLKNSVSIGILGASGYTGSEIIRLLANQPYFDITLMTADRKAGQSIGAVFSNPYTNVASSLTLFHASFEKKDFMKDENKHRIYWVFIMTV